MACGECDRLRAENRELREELAAYTEFEPENISIPDCQVKHKLTSHQARILDALLRASPKVLSVDKLLHAMSAYTDVNRENINVHICRIRKRIPAGSIVNVFSKGYYIPSEKLDALL